MMIFFPLPHRTVEAGYEDHVSAHARAANQICRPHEYLI